jgi:putative spermidine/putrescine transport system permease protein
MHISRTSKILLGGFAALALAFIYLPLMVVVINSFSTSLSMSWPPPGFTLDWWGKAFTSEGAIKAIVTSLIVAAASSLIALLLGTLLAFALHRFSFFGKSDRRKTFK